MMTQISKFISVLSFFVVIATNVYAQTVVEPADQSDTTVYVAVDETPQFPGGNTAMMQFVANHVKYPVEARISGATGTVFVGFVVTKQGDVKKIKTISRTSSILNAEAERVVGLFPQWTPGKLRGKAVNVRFVIPIKFNLDKELPRDTLRVDSIASQAQVFTVVETMPQPKDGMENLYKFINKHIDYPKKAWRQNLEGTVFVEFIVNRDASITGIKTVKGLSPELDAEAERVISIMPPWIAGTQNGKAVKVKYVLPVRFRK